MIAQLKVDFSMSSDQGAPGYLLYIRDKITQLYGDYNKPFFSGSLLKNQYFMESIRGFFSWLTYYHFHFHPMVFLQCLPMIFVHLCPFSRSSHLFLSPFLGCLDCFGPDFSILNLSSRWWFQTCFIFTPNLGEDEPILTCAYFSDGLVQPPTRLPPLSLG